MYWPAKWTCNDYFFATPFLYRHDIVYLSFTQYHIHVEYHIHTQNKIRFSNLGFEAESITLMGGCYEVLLAPWC